MFYIYLKFVYIYWFLTFNFLLSCREIQMTYMYTAQTDGILWIYIFHCVEHTWPKRTSIVQENSVLSEQSVKDMNSFILCPVLGEFLLQLLQNARLRHFHRWQAEAPSHRWPFTLLILNTMRRCWTNLMLNAFNGCSTLFMMTTYIHVGLVSVGASTWGPQVSK